MTDAAVVPVAGLDGVGAVEWPRLVAGWLLSFTSGHTRRAYRGDVLAWAAWCDKVGVDPMAARRPHVDGWVQTMVADQARPATVARRVAAISSLYTYAIDIGTLERNPAVRVKRPRPPEVSSTRWLTAAEMRAVIACAAEHGSRDHAVILLLALSGLRSAELRALLVEELGFYGGYTTILVHGKGGREVRVPIPPVTADVVEEVVGERRAGFLFDGGPWAGWRHDRPETHVPALPGERPLSHDQLNRIVTRIANRAGVNGTSPKVTSHSFRHSAITIALDNGVSERDTETFARHLDPRTTRRYDRTRGDWSRHASFTLARILADPDRPTLTG